MLVEGCTEGRQQDEPRGGERGIGLDSARNRQTVHFRHLHVEHRENVWIAL